MATQIVGGASLYWPTTTKTPQRRITVSLRGEYTGYRSQRPRNVETLPCHVHARCCPNLAMISVAPRSKVNAIRFNLVIYATGTVNHVTLISVRLLHSTSLERISATHDNVIKWKHFPRYWPFVRRIHRSPVNSRTKASDAELLCFLWSAPE